MFPQVRRLVALNAAQGVIVLILGITTQEVPEKMLLMVLTDLTIVWTLMITMMIEATAMVGVKVFTVTTLLGLVKATTTAMEMETTGMVDDGMIETVDSDDDQISGFNFHFWDPGQSRTT